MDGKGTVDGMLRGKISHAGKARQSQPTRKEESRVEVADSRAMEFLLVQLLDGSLSVLLLRHDDESESTLQIDFVHFPELAKKLQNRTNEDRKMND